MLIDTAPLHCCADQTLRYLVLIGFSREPRFSLEKPVIDLNVQYLHEALTQVLNLV